MISNAPRSGLQESFEFSDLSEQFLKVRGFSLVICKPLCEEDFVIQAHDDVSPTKWHLAHTSWFFENFILREFAENYQAFNTNYRFLFNSYYEGAGPFIRRTDRGKLSRPNVNEVFAYREYVNKEMLKLFEQKLSPEAAFEISKRTMIGIHHEQQHQELMLMDLKFNYFFNPLMPLYVDKPKSEPCKKKESKWLPIRHGRYEIGAKNTAPFFYDNETSRHVQWIEDYEICNQLVTVEDYLEFIADGGYERPELWLSDGWAWVQKESIRQPAYWFERTGSRFLYDLCEKSDFDKMAPVTHVSYFEAEAFATWKNCRLPTEYEWEVAASQHGSLEDAHFLNLEKLHMQNLNENNFFGSAWEWTSSAYLPYPRFKQELGVLGEYNGKFMSGQYVLRGGSYLTPESHFRLSYRNYFYPHQRWAVTGFRLARSTEN